MSELIACKITSGGAVVAVMVTVVVVGCVAATLTDGVGCWRLMMSFGIAGWTAVVTAVGSAGVGTTAAVLAVVDASALVAAIVTIGAVIAGVTVGGMVTTGAVAEVVTAVIVVVVAVVTEVAVVD